jgi:signal transduction histidine kinase
MPGGLHVIAIQKGIQLSYTPPPDDVINIDDGYMARVVDNLVSNAIKYTSAGGQVGVRVVPDATHVTVEVRDTGLGIPQEDLPRIFEAFYRVRSSEHERAEGSGLGLSIVKTIVEQHGGRVLVKSEPGKGSTFEVILPRAQAG